MAIEVKRRNINIKYDLTGKKFGRLTAINRVYIENIKGYKWKCICDCGNNCTIRGADLVREHTISCGCYRKEKHRKHLLRMVFHINVANILFGET